MCALYRGAAKRAGNSSFSKLRLTMASDAISSLHSVFSSIQAKTRECTKNHRTETLIVIFLIFVLIKSVARFFLLKRSPHRKRRREREYESNIAFRPAPEVRPFVIDKHVFFFFVAFNYPMPISSIRLVSISQIRYFFP